MNHNQQHTPPQPRFSRRAFLANTLKTTLGIAALAGGSTLYINEIEPGWLELTQLTLELPRLTLAFAGYRLVHISDIHADEDWMHGERLGEIVALVNQQQPDAVAITGDFVTRRAEAFVDVLHAALRELRPRDATVAVLGNHDHWSNPWAVREMLAASGIVDVSNTVYTVQRGSELLHLAGVDDVWEEQDRLDAVLAQLPPAGAAVLLAHEPDFADRSAPHGRFDVQLSGHSHGGQVRLPLFGPPILPYLGERYPVGLYRVGEMWQYTTRGVGMVRPQVRFNCRPEITVLTLQPAQA
jgi:hypothetical protein